MKKKEQIKALKKVRDIQMARLPKQRQMIAMGKSIFEEFTIDEQVISQSEKAILDYIKDLGDKIAKLEEKILKNKDDIK